MTRRRTWLRALLAVAIALVALLAVLVAVALRSHRGQQLLVARIADWAEPALGLRLEAQTFFLRPLAGELEIEQLRLGVRGEAPLVTIDRLQAGWSAGSILSRRPQIGHVEIVGPIVDLEAPRPAGSERSAEAAPTTELPLSIERISVRGGRVLGPPVASVADDWSLEDLEVDGRFDGRRLVVARLGTAATIEASARPPVALDIAAVAAAALDGSAEVERLTVSGEGLQAAFSGRLSPDLAASRVAFEIESDPALLLLGEPAAEVEARGEVDLAAWTGRVTLETRDQPGRLLGRFVDADLATRLELAATTLDCELDLRLEGSRTVAGVARVGVERAGRRVAALVASPSLEVDGSLPLAVGLDLSLLPDEDGSRRVTARLASAEAKSFEAWQVEDGDAVVEERSANRLLQLVSELYPRLVDPDSIAALPALGRLDVESAVGGQLANPDLDVAVRLQLPGGGRVTLDAAGSPLTGPLLVATSGTGVEIGELTDGLRGRLDWRGRLDDPLGVARGSLEVMVNDLAAGEGPLAETLRATISGDRRKIDWQLDGRLGAGGRLAGSGSLRPELPLADATASLTWTTPDERAPQVEADLVLEGGALGLAAQAALGQGEPATLAAAVPLGALTAVPELSGLAQWPLVRSDGPVTVEWQVAVDDWTRFLPGTAAAERVERLAGGSEGKLLVDPHCPACSTGTIAVQSLAVELGGKRAVASGDLELVLGNGRLRLAPWSLSGDGLELALEGTMDLAPAWALGQSPELLVAGTGAVVTARVDSSWLEALPLEVVEPGVLAIDAKVEGSLDALAATASFSAPDLAVRAAAWPDLLLAAPRGTLRLADGVVDWEQAGLEVGELDLTSAGRARLDAPLAATAGELTVVSGLPVLAGASLPFAIQEGMLTIEDGRVRTEGGDGPVRLTIPVDGRSDGVARVEWEVPVNDWTPLLARLGGGDDPELLEAGVRGAVSLPLAAPAAAVGTVTMSSLRVVMRGRESRVEPELAIGISDSTLRLTPFTVLSGEERFAFEAAARLEGSWEPGDPVQELVVDFQVVGEGEIDSGLVNPLLAGGRAEGAFGLDIAVRGTPSDYGGKIEIAGPDASVFFRSPYLTRIESPRLQLVVRNGRVALESGSAKLNEGVMTMSGELLGEAGSDLRVEVADSLFRLDYGLLATLDADLRYRAAADGSTTLTGSLTVERGSLTRPVALDLDLLSQLLAPIDLTTTEDDPLDLIALDLEVRTREGVRVKNNLGDLLVRWEPLAVTGTLARPVIEGQVEADPGGLLQLYGQTVRLDKAVLEYPGEEGAEPRLDFEATTSLEDPTIGRLAGEDPFRSATRPRQEEVAAPAAAEVTADLARYYGEQLAGRLGESVGVNVSLRPLLIFGEADPGARLTVSRDLSPFFAIAASVDLRKAEGQTYLLELHELRRLPRLVGQAFTDDESAYGGALLQRLEFGGSREAEDPAAPRIGKISVDPPAGVSKRGIKRALALEKGDAFDERRRFLAEFELVDYLMRKGYPDARVSIQSVSAGRRRGKIELEIGIEPGPRVEFRFLGEKISGPLRRLIRSYYRPDFFEPESIEEMRSETVRALRSRGFLEPQVDIVVELLDPQRPNSDRLVTISTEGGIKMSAESPVFLGVPPEDAEALQATFVSNVQRVELAIGLESADRRLLRALADLGYAEARLVSRYQTLDERVLTVEIDPGPRQRIASVAIEAVGGELPMPVAELEPLLAVAAGDPLRRRRLARSAVAIERELGSRGFLDARVRSVVESDPGRDELARDVRFLVSTGTVAQLDEIEFDGLRSTSERWARSVTELRPGQTLARDDLAGARTKLWRTGLFSAVGTDVSEGEEGRRRVVFDLAERDRYRLTYGLRWDSEEGVGAVLDATDDNFLGRAWTLGLRALYSSEENSLRWLTRIPRAFGGAGSLEFFAAAREVREAAFDIIFGPTEITAEILEGTLQYSHPLSERTTFRLYGRYTDSKRALPFVTLRVKNPQLGMQFLYDSRSQEPLTERGTFASVDFSGSEELLGGDLRYVRFFSQLNLYRPIGRVLGRRLSWSQSFRLGLADAFDQELIRDVRFFAGGEYSVRGYETESLGDQERFGSMSEATGGAALLIVNQELRWRLFTDYFLVLFWDAGNVWQKTGDLGLELFESTGIGLRAQTPVGLLRLDLARPLDRRPEIDPEYKLYFGLGTTF